MDFEPKLRTLDSTMASRPPGSRSKKIAEHESNWSGPTHMLTNKLARRTYSSVQTQEIQNPNRWTNRLASVLTSDQDSLEPSLLGLEFRRNLAENEVMVIEPDNHRNASGRFRHLHSANAPRRKPLRWRLRGTCMELIRALV